MSITAGQAMGQLVPDRKFIVTQFNKRNDNPYGSGLGRKCYWYYWFKKSLIKYAMIFADKFGMPTLIGKYTPGIQPAEKTELLAMLASIQQESQAIFPNTTEVDMLEAQRTGTVQIYKDLTDFFDDAMSKAVLGQTLTSSEGRRSGSLALGEVHADLKQDVLERDASWFEEVINATIIRWSLDFNYAGVLDYPKIRFQVNKTENMSDRANVYSTLKNLGMPLAVHQLKDEFKIDDPTDPEDVIPGGFGAMGEQPFNIGENTQTQAGPGGIAAGGKAPKPTGKGETATTGAGGGSSFAEFSEKDANHQEVDKYIPGAIGAAVSAVAPVRKKIAAAIKRDGLKVTKRDLSKIVSKEIQPLHMTAQRAMFKAFHSGRYEVRQRAGDTASFTEAVTDAQAARLLQRLARSVADNAEANIVRVVRAALDESLKANETSGAFLGRLDDVFKTAGVTPANSAQIATAFETSMATLYNAGKMSELLQMTDTFPSWIYLTRDDGRVRPNHQLMHRFIAEADDDIWGKIFPPNGYNCRCTVDGLTAEEAQNLRGVRHVLPAGAGPDKGFKASPIAYLRRQ